MALAVLGLAVVPTRRLQAPGPLRGVLLVLLFVGCGELGALYDLASGVFMRLGGTPSWELIRMAPPLIGYAPKVVSAGDPLVLLGARPSSGRPSSPPSCGGRGAAWSARPPGGSGRPAA